MRKHKLKNLFKERERMITALDIASMYPEGISFAEYLRKELRKVEKEIDKMLEENKGIVE